MDHWEAAFRQKSTRRANAAVSFQTVVGWALIAVTFLGFVVAVLTVLNL